MRIPLDSEMEGNRFRVLLPWIQFAISTQVFGLTRRYLWDMTEKYKALTQPPLVIEPFVVVELKRCLRGKPLLPMDGPAGWREHTDAEAAQFQLAEYLSQLLPTVRLARAIPLLGWLLA